MEPSTVSALPPGSDVGRPTQDVGGRREAAARPLNVPLEIATARAGVWARSLPTELGEWLWRHVEPRRLAAGQRLFGRGDAPDGLYCSTRGTIRITGVSAAGDESILAMLDAPHWFGEIALFDDEPRTHDAWAASDATVLRIAQDALRHRLDERPADWRHLARLLTQKLRVVFQQIEEAALLPPTARLARRLATMAAGYDSGPTRGPRRLAVSQEDLARMLALSRQTVNQSLKELESTGTIRRGRGAIDVLDAAGLDRTGR